MPIKSYLIFSHAGRESYLLKSLSLYANCEVIPSERNEVFVFISETNSEQEDELIIQKLESEKDVHHIQFISGFITEPYEKARI